MEMDESYCATIIPNESRSGEGFLKEYTVTSILVSKEKYVLEYFLSD
jgi:hypothetical protein